MVKNSKKHKHRIITIHVITFSVLVALMCLLIFMFSAQNSGESSMTSGRITGLVLRIFFPRLSEQPFYIQYRVSDTVSTIIRKGAHFSEYAILAQLTFQLLLALPRPRKDSVCALCGFLFAAIYAATDEFHQSFVPGRAMMAKDVLIDSLGALTGVIIAVIVTKKLKKKYRK